MAAFWDLTQGGQYNVLNNGNDYQVISGVFALPVAEEPPTNTSELAAWSPVATVKAHAPYRIRNVQFRYDKSGTPPVIPSPESSGAFVFLNGSIGFASPKPNLSFTAFDWTVAGVYTFVENCRASNDDGYVLGAFPFPTIMDQDNALTYTPAAVPLGAISQAGDDAKRAYTQGQLINNSTGWMYNSASYFPYILLNNEIINGSTTFQGATPSPPINADTQAGFPFVIDSVNEGVTSPTDGTIDDSFGDYSPF